MLTGQIFLFEQVKVKERKTMMMSISEKVTSQFVMYRCLLWFVQDVENTLLNTQHNGIPYCSNIKNNKMQTQNYSQYQYGISVWSTATWT